jgi:hypothetical protein
VGVGGGAQVPVPPAATLQTRPVQQSPVAVQVPPLGTQTMPPSLGVVVRQRSVPVESGTHGLKWQHSAAVLHVCPGCRQQLGSVPLKIPVAPPSAPQAPEPRHRGRPSVSYAQHWALGETGHVQSLSALEQALAPPVSLQIPPGTWFPMF